MRTPIPQVAWGRRCLAMTLVLFLTLLATQPLFAQTAEDIPQVTRTYALENVRIVQAPGRVLEQGTIVIRDGLIHAIGEDVPIPFDAERIQADSMVAYAGFIDGLSTTGVPKPKENNNQQRPEDPGNPPNDLAGIQPDRDVRTMLDPEENSIEKLRNAGFAAAHVVPHGRMLPGTGALILLAGDDPNALVLQGDASLFAQYIGARGGYPATQMAIMAKMRQLYREAQRRQRMETLYADNASGLTRPEYDPVHYAFFPVLEGNQSVFFHTKSALDIYRTLDLQESLGFPLVLTGLKQSYDAVDALKEADVPLLLTLELPKESKSKKAKADEDSTATEEEPAYDANFRTTSFANIEGEKANLEIRREMEREKYLATAATLHDAGLTFGFATMDVKPDDILSNVRTMVENGLPEDAALAALTTNTASILGVSSSLGTIDAGKIANLVVTTGPLFEEESKVRFVFVDGQKFEMEVKEKKNASGDGSETANPAGVWAYSIETPQGSVGGVITVESSGNDLSGTITNDAGGGEPADIEDAELDGSTLSFSFDAGEFGRINVTMDIDGDEVDGSFEVPGFGSMPMTGSRSSDPNF